MPGVASPPGDILAPAVSGVLMFRPALSLLRQTPEKGETSLTLSPVRGIRENDHAYDEPTTTVEADNPEDQDTVSQVLQSMDIASMIKQKQKISWYKASRDK